MNLDAFDRAAQISARSFDHLSQGIDSQLDAAQQRHRDRLAKLRSQRETEQQQIRALTMKRRNRTQEWPLPLPNETSRQYRRRSNARDKPSPLAICFVVIMAFWLLQLVKASHDLRTLSEPSTQQLND